MIVILKMLVTGHPTPNASSFRAARCKSDTLLLHTMAQSSKDMSYHEAIVSNIIAPEMFYCRIAAFFVFLWKPAKAQSTGPIPAWRRQRFYVQSPLNHTQFPCMKQPPFVK